MSITEPVSYTHLETRNDSDYPLLPGTLNTFLGNSFVASGHLRGVMPGESFELALGADEGIEMCIRDRTWPWPAPAS